MDFDLIHYLFLIFFLILFFFKKMDQAGGTKFTIDLRI